MISITPSAFMKGFAFMIGFNTKPTIFLSTFPAIILNNLNTSIYPSQWSIPHLNYIHRIILSAK